MAEQSLPVAVPPVAREAAPARSRRPLIIAGVVAAVATLATTYWVHSMRFEGTDDAQIDGNISNVSPKISGNVLAVLVSENQLVKEGQELADIDTTDLDIAVAQAKAQVAQAQAQLEAEDPSVPITQASNLSAVATAHSDV